MTTLLLIDVQKDFHPGGSLAIPTASDDAARIASFIKRHGESINRIVVTLDTHPKWHIAHPTFWTAAGTASAAAADDDGREGGAQYHHPEPFTVISSEDIRSKKWIPIPNPSQQQDAAVIVDPTIFAKGGDIPENLFSNENNISSSLSPLDLTKYCVEYTHRLESSKHNHRKFSLTIWPEHCIMGSDGHDVVDIVAHAIATWRGGEDTAEEGKKKEKRTVEYVRKGMNSYTEMFSAICAEVPVDASTSFNYALVDSVSTDEVVVIRFESICSLTFVLMNTHLQL